jgi:AcrR family transcriptional regulator
MKDRKMEIRNAALKLFLEKGLSKTTMQEISKDTSIARSTIYEYYSSKEEILYDLLNEIVSQKVHYNEENSFRQKLIEIAEYFFVRLKSNYQLYKLLFQEIPVLKKESKEQFSVRQDLSLDVVTTLFENEMQNKSFKENLTPNDLTFYFKALVGQKMSDYLFSKNNFNPEKEAKEIVDILLNGVRRENCGKKDCKS